MRQFFQTIIAALFAVIVPAVARANISCPSSSDTPNLIGAGIVTLDSFEIRRQGEAEFSTVSAPDALCVSVRRDGTSPSSPFIVIVSSYDGTTDVTPIIGDTAPAGTSLRVVLSITLENYRYIDVNIQGANGRVLREENSATSPGRIVITGETAPIHYLGPNRSCSDVRYARDAVFQAVVFVSIRRFNGSPAEAAKYQLTTSARAQSTVRAFFGTDRIELINFDGCPYAYYSGPHIEVSGVWPEGTINPSLIGGATMQQLFALSSEELGKVISLKSPFSDLTVTGTFWPTRGEELSLDGSPLAEKFMGIAYELAGYRTNGAASLNTVQQELRPRSTSTGVVVSRRAIQSVRECFSKRGKKVKGRALTIVGDRLVCRAKKKR